MKRKTIQYRPKKMTVVALKPPESLYDKDFAKWIHEQKRCLKTFEFDHLDTENLIEELDALSKSQKLSLGSHLRNLLMHLLKLQVQPSKKSRSWDVSITNARLEIEDICDESPSLKRILPDLIQKEYPRARILASKETGLNLKKFPLECPWSKEEILH